jgi:predicted nucleic acid-binding protein
MIVVSNTSPITNLSTIGKLHLLQQLYGEIFISSSVFKELTQWGDSIPGATEVKTSNWIQVKSINNISLVQSLKEQLDEGESSVIALALELRANWLIIDEQLGRKIAIEYNLKITGILGILIEAKRQGLISLVKPILDDLINIAKFWVDSSLYNRILSIVGES